MDNNSYKGNQERIFVKWIHQTLSIFWNYSAWVRKLEVDWKKVLRLILKSIFSTHKVLSESKKMQTWGERVFWEWILLLTTGSLLNVLLLQGTSCTCTCIYSFNRFPDKVLLGLQTLRRTNITSGEEHEVNESKLHQRHKFDLSELMLDPPLAHCLTSRYTTGRPSCSCHNYIGYH